MRNLNDANMQYFDIPFFSGRMDLRRPNG